MGLFGVAHGWGKSPPLPKICHTYPKMMILGNIIPYKHINISIKHQNIKISKKHMDHVTHPLSSADISIFPRQIRKFYHIKKYRYRLHFGT